MVWSRWRVLDMQLRQLFQTRRVFAHRRVHFVLPGSLGLLRQRILDAGSSPFASPV